MKQFLTEKVKLLQRGHCNAMCNCKVRILCAQWRSWHLSVGCKHSIEGLKALVSLSVPEGVTADDVLSADEVVLSTQPILTDDEMIKGNR